MSYSDFHLYYSAASTQYNPLLFEHCFCQFTDTRRKIACQSLLYCSVCDVQWILGVILWVCLFTVLLLDPLFFNLPCPLLLHLVISHELPQETPRKAMLLSDVGYSQLLPFLNATFV